jgi:hypothetical protein
MCQVYKAKRAEGLLRPETIVFLRMITLNRTCLELRGEGRRGCGGGKGRNNPNNVCTCE